MRKRSLAKAKRLKIGCVNWCIKHTDELAKDTLGCCDLGKRTIFVRRTNHEGTPLDDQQVKLILAHEIGHALGFDSERDAGVAEALASALIDNRML